jgi:NitT/TauT family transport system ATP-binding protein
VFATAKPWLRVEDVREEASAPRAIERPPARGSSEARSAVLDGVSVAFGDAPPVLEDVSFSVGAGEAVCLVGPSGGGKSTILNLLAGLAKPTSGRVLVDGSPVEGPGPDRAVVFQDAALFPWLTLEENIAFPLELAGVSRAERKERTEELLALVQLKKFRRAHPHELSGGMRQRGAIARALATRPGMLLFDEPFAALDGQMRELLQNEVERIVRASRTTMLFVTHQIEEAVRLGDRVVLVGTRPGRVLGDVPIDLARPRRAGDPHALRIVREIAEGIRAEVDKVARDEADDVLGAYTRDGTDPRKRVGGGI